MTIKGGFYDGLRPIQRRVLLRQLPRVGGRLVGALDASMAGGGAAAAVGRVDDCRRKRVDDLWTTQSHTSGRGERRLFPGPTTITSTFQVQATPYLYLSGGIYL